ncbi:MAG: molybdopterin-dependent oxidoreductase, partial [Candidatus Hydrogenedentes bacterium]|nr:molybdopterin-dependent oxidoreductase [Candidatus Hydrogenedentota bacterium]
MAKSAWPGPDRRKQIGARVARHDGAPKVTGAAKYTYDINRPDMLYARMLLCPHGHAKVNSVDTSAAEAMPGVAMVVVERTRQGALPECTYDGAIVATVAAATEELASDAAAAIKVDYEVLEVVAEDRDGSLVSGRSSEDGDAGTAMDGAEVVSEGYYGLPTITHCCLESHGQVCEFRDGDLHIWPSTQNVSGYAPGVRVVAGLPNEQIHVDCQHIGGGFGSKFSSGRWGKVGVEISKATGKPVKIMLERDQELKSAGHRPSNFGNVKIGLKKDGSITGWHSDVWGTNGQGRFNQPALPYSFTGIPSTYTKSQGVATNRGSVQAWRAPNHPQACYLTMSAMEDAAAAIGMDPLEFFKKNLGLGEADRQEYWAEEFDVAA